MSLSYSKSFLNDSQSVPRDYLEQAARLYMKSMMMTIMTMIMMMIMMMAMMMMMMMTTLIMMMIMMVSMVISSLRLLTRSRAAPKKVSWIVHSISKKQTE